MPTSFWVRIDSSPANNPSLNLTGDASFQIQFVNATDINDPVGTTGDGDFQLDYLGEGVRDDDTLVLINGQYYEFEYDTSGTLPSTNPGRGQLPDNTWSGEPVSVIIVYDYPAPGDSTRLTFTTEREATQAEMDAFGNGAIAIDNPDTSPPVTPVCYVAGTLIETPDGPRAVEELATGDLVMTVDAGAQPLRWVTSTDLAWPESDDKFKPIQIKAGALGQGLPTADLSVSPQHHVLIRDPLCQELFGEDEVLAPAKGLTDMPGIRWMQGKKQVSYYHLLLARHSLLVVAGIASESFYPGPTSTRMMEREKREMLLSLVPALRTDPETGYGPFARPRITRRQAEKLVALMQARTPEMAVA